MSLSTPCEKFEFVIFTLMGKFEFRSSGARVGIRMGMRETECAGVWVFRLVRFSPYQSHAAQRDSHWSPHAMIRSLRSPYGEL